MLLTLFCVIAYWAFENFYTPDTYGTAPGDGAKTEIPAYLLPSSTTSAIVSHEHYMLSYSERYEQAEWVAYLLKKSHLTQDHRKRPYFVEDPYVKTKSADWRNYRGSGYDRGHLCPAGDRRFSKQAYNETFYTSNISPMDKRFNAGVWNRLEIQVRQWAKKYGEIFVVTGGVLEKGLMKIGEEDVNVPRFYFKIVAMGPESDLKTIAFIIPANETQKPLNQFTVTVDSIEILTGINFFEALPNAVEMRLESEVDVSDWKF